ncbi:MAG: DNA/RNA nuclease SfsA [Acidiferrobacterales bacterium]
MKFEQPLLEARLIQRYKRFLADVELPNGSQLTAHTPNTGAMLGCAEPGSRVWLRDTANPKRKYIYSWELVEASSGALVGINTGLPPKLVQEAIADGRIAELQGYKILRREVRYGLENSRIDLLLQDGSAPDCYVEVKNVTAITQGGVAIFPDAVSARGSKHLRELMQMVKQGYRAVIFYCVQRQDAESLSPADVIDPEYGETLRRAMAAGVEAIAYRATVSPQEIRLADRLPVVI